ncbi:MAG TPA: DUF4411 family protein [Acidimicrobiia bacterium]|nr:DUF4411 family protein [Acidimicrobiia bacterium]
MAYVLDADVFIRAKNDYYSFELAPAFWEWLDRANASDTVRSVQRVREELLAGDDELADWVKGRPAFFVTPDEATLAAITRVSEWANGSDRFEQAAKATFLDSADLFLIAHALVHSDGVVTHERSEPLRRSKIKIPEVCREFDVEVMTPFDMLRNEGVRFVLQP